MMRLSNPSFSILLLLGLFLGLPLSFLAAQTGRPVHDFNTERLSRTRTSMWVLGTWGAANMAVGAIGLRRSQGENRAFRQMNLAWGAVNLGLAAAGWWSAAHSDPGSFDLEESIRQHHRLQKIFLFNAGLDLAYITGGFWLRERAKTSSRRPERLRGYGRSIILQGAFLFVFDLGAALYQQGLEKQVPPLLQHSKIGFTEQGVGLTIQW